MRHADGWNHPHFCLLAFCAGVVALRFFPQLPPLWIFLSVAAILTSCAIGFHGLRAPAAFALGLTWAAITATTVVDATLPLELEKRDVVVSGRVVGVPKVGDDYQRFDFAVEQLTWRGEVYPAPRKIRLKHYRTEPKILAGEKWKFSARLKRARGYQNPGATFDYETHLFHHRIRASGYVRNRPPPQLLATQSPYSIAAFRQRTADVIRATLPSGGRAGLVAALVVGLRGDMTRENWDVLLRTGTIHLLAISGLHIGLVSGLVLLLGAWLWRLGGRLSLRLPAPKAGVAVGLLAGLGYALLAGMSIPTQRAVCMLAVVAAALFFQRRPFGIETLLMALAVVLAVDPLAPLSGGLWLSFGAVAVLLLGALRARDAHNNNIASGLMTRIWRTMRAWSWVQVILFFGMAPLLVVMFQRVSLVAPLANLAAIPAIGMVAVPLGLVGLSLQAIGFESGAAAAFHGALWVIDVLWRLLETLAHSAWSVWQPLPPPLWAMPLAVIGVLLLLAPRTVPARWCGLLWLLPLFFTAAAKPNAGEFRYTLLEVGHGLASVVQTENHWLVYDAGPRYVGGFDSGESIVVPFLRHAGADKLDVVVISHGDNDHIGGQRALREHFTAAKVLSSAPEKLIDAQKCYRGQKWHWDGVDFEVLWPPRDSPRSGNDASCVLKIHSKFGALLLTGDIGKAAELGMVSSATDLEVDVLQAPHHGSKTSSTAAFLNRVNPHIAVVGVGYLNRYGHPHRVVAARYARRQIPLYQTAEEGAMSVDFAATGIELRGHRGAQKKYWVQAAKRLRAPIRFSVRPTTP